MSIGKINHIITRIKAATPESPIAVFIDSTRADLFNAMFASTVATKQLIDSKHPSLIGVYHNKMNIKLIRDEIPKYAAKARSKTAINSNNLEVAAIA